MSTPIDIERRAKQVTKRQERAAKRMYDDLAGKLRSQLRKQVDEMLKTHTREWVFLLINGGKLRLTPFTKQREPVVDYEAATRALDSFDPFASEKRARDEGGQYQDEQGLVHTPIPGDTDNGEIVSLPE